MRFILGVSRHTTNNGVRGELGRYPISIFIFSQVYKYLKRLYNKEGGCLLQRAFNEQLLLQGNQKSWLVVAQKIVSFPNSFCSTVEHFTKCLQLKYDQFWTEKTVQNSEHKLCTYALFKKEFKFESYLDLPIERARLCLLTRFRLSSHKLRVETGRYEKPYLPRENRICLMCENGIEDEQHFILKCPYYKNERSNLKLSLEISRLDSSQNAFVKIMSCNDLNNTLPVIKFLEKSYDIRDNKLNVR